MARVETIDQAQALLGERRFAEAAALLVRAAASGDPAAQAELAHWRIAGNIVRRDLAAARALLARAGAAGDRSSALLHAYFLASGTGGAEDWPSALAGLRALAPHEPLAREQLRLLDSMALGANGFPGTEFEPRPLSEAPYAVAGDSFLTRGECDYLAKAGEPTLQPSVVVDPATGRMVPNPVRTSDGTQFGVYAEDLVVNAINRRIAAFSGTRLEQGEPLQLLRYRHGAQYRPHMDALSAEPNQRILTVLVYLSDGYEGGETIFPRTGLSFRGKAGDALLFRNTRADGAADPLALHAGLPVTRGVKYLATRWIRAGRFSYPPPRPLVDL